MSKWNKTQRENHAQKMREYWAKRRNRTVHRTATQEMVTIRYKGGTFELPKKVVLAAL